MIQKMLKITQLLLVFFIATLGSGVVASEKIDALVTEINYEENNKFLDVDDAFIISSDLLDDEFIVRWKIADNYYLYKHRFSFTATGAELGEPFIPEGLQKTDEYFGDVEVYYKHVEITIPFKRTESKVVLRLNYQGCADAGLCYTPTSRYLIYEVQADGQLQLVSGVENKIPGIPVQPLKNVVTSQSAPVFEGQTENLSSVLAEGNMFWILLAFLGAGLLLTFTPCVLPMVPILSGIIAGEGKNITTAKAFRLSFVYVQAMAITYAILGVLVARAGNSLSGYLQSPLILGIVAVIFILLALSMFGLFEIRLPGFLQKRVQGISEKQRGGNYLGVAFMGVISTLIVSPCTSAPLTAALLFIANNGNEVMGGLSLYFLGLGMGIPLMIIGVSEGRLLPSAGAWMESIKQLFGFMLLAMALYITDHLFAGPLFLLLWSILLITAANFFGAFAPAVTAMQLLKRSLSIAVFLIGVIYMLGAAMGNDRLLKPLAGLQVTSAVNEKHQVLKFKRFSGLAELDINLQQAKQMGRPVMLDFFAEYCIACYEFEDYTFSDPLIQNFLAEKNVLLLQADVTANSATDIELMKHYNVLGLPSILFFESGGKELTTMRATGFEDVETFLERLETVFR